MGQPPNMRELVSSSDGVTFWASSEKAERDLGYSPRPLDRGLRETLAAEGWL
jgi:nucleoside-diphosphate-sugar epimerase